MSYYNHRTLAASGSGGGATGICFSDAVASSTTAGHTTKRREREGEADDLVQQQEVDDSTSQHEQQQPRPTLHPDVKTLVNTASSPNAPLLLRFRFSVGAQAVDCATQALSLLPASFRRPLTLDLERCDLSDSDLGVILDHLNDSNSQPSSADELVQPLAALLIAGNKITSAGLRSALFGRPMNHLEHLGVTANPLGTVGLALLREFVTSCTSLRMLHATRIAWTAATGPLQRDEVRLFLAAVDAHPGLTRVYFKQNEVAALSASQGEENDDDALIWPAKVVIV